MFIERPTEMAFLEQFVIRERRPLVIVAGAMGTGKTSLSVIFAQRHASAFSSIHHSTAMIHHFLGHVGNVTDGSTGGTPDLPSLLIVDSDHDPIGDVAS